MKLLEEVREFELIEQIVKVQPDGLIIISDNESREILEKEFYYIAARLNLASPKITTLEDQAAILSGSIIIVASIADENSLYEKLVTITPKGANVFRLWRDLFVIKTAMLYTKKQVSADELFQHAPPTDNSELKEIRSYAVLCTPRTGSTMLVDMLRQLDVLGFPREHLRDGVLSLVEHTDFDFEHWMAAVLKSQVSKNGVFGTKIISHFLLRAIELNGIKSIQIPELQFTPKIIRLRRRDLIAHALSTYLSQKSQVFFESDQKKRDLRANYLDGLKYDFDSLYKVYKGIRRQEDRVDKVLDKFDGEVFDLIYEDVVIKPTAELEKVFSFLEIDIPKNFVAPIPLTSKLDDSKSQNLYEQFSHDLSARRTIDMKRKNLVPGPYQAVDEDVVDYQYFTLPDVPFRYRGPAPESLNPGSFFCTLGAAQTFGRFCTKPFPNIVSEAINIPVFNMGYSGAGPSLYLSSRPLINIVNSASFAIIQVMSGRSEGNSLMRCDTGRNIVTWLPTGEECFTEKAFRNLLADYNEDEVMKVVRESRDNWLKHMVKLLDSINVPKILLWISERDPKYNPVVNGKLYDLLGTFPHLVDDIMIEKISKHVDDVVFSISNRGVPHSLVSRFTGMPLQVRFPNGEFRGEDRSYPSPEMHEDAAAMLIPVIRKLFNRK